MPLIFKNCFSLLLILVINSVSARRQQPDGYFAPKQANNDAELDETERHQSIQDQYNRLTDQIKQSNQYHQKSDRHRVRALIENTHKHHAHDDQEHFLSHLLESRQSAPVAVFLAKQANSYNQNKKQPRGEIIRGSTEDSNDLHTPEETDAYVLYNIIKTTQQEEDIDDQAHKVFEKTKQVLRSAFIGRCNQKRKCEDTCSQKKKANVCEYSCKQKYDQFNSCDEPKEEKQCVPRKWGSTMPPRMEKNIPYC